MIEVFSKNGCFMLNVGPTPEGEIYPEEVSVLTDIGEWLDKNGEAVYGSGPFEVGFGEGKLSKNGAFQESKIFTKKDYRFTYKTGSIYVFPMTNCSHPIINCVLPDIDLAGRTTYTIKSLRRANEHGIKYDIRSVEILGSDIGVTYSQDSSSLVITTDKPITDKLPICFKVSVE